jgi:hypothetical protein
MRLLRMRLGFTLMVRSRAKHGVSNNEATNDDRE